MPAEYSRQQALLLLHFLIGSLGCIEIFVHIAAAITNFIGPSPSIGLNIYLTLFFRPQKPGELLSYLLSASGLIAFWVLIYSAFRAVDWGLCDRLIAFWDRSAGRRMFYAAIWAALLALGWRTLKLSASHEIVFVILVLWMFLPFLWVFFLHERMASPESPRLRRWSTVLMGVALLQFVSIFYPFIFQPLMMINEFFNIPEQTKIVVQEDSQARFWSRSQFTSSKTPQARWVDNTDFINSHHIWGMTAKNDLLTGGQLLPPIEGTALHMPRTAALSSYIAAQRMLSNDKLYYDDFARQLVCISSMSPEEQNDLEQIITGADPLERSTFLFSGPELALAKVENRDYTPEELEFLKKNKFELHWQILNRWVIHHHNFFLGSINELALGRPAAAINMQYGFLSAWILKTFLQHWHGVTYQGYFKAFFFFYYIYYGFFVLATVYLLKRVEYILPVLLLTFGALNYIGFQFLFLGPGVNPIRHFFDLAVIVSLLRYLETGRWSYLLLTSLSVLAGVWMNLLFGLFSFFALLGTLGLRHIGGIRARGWFEFTTLFVLALAVGAMLCFVPTGRDVLFRYYLLGLVGFAPKFISPKALLALFSFCFFVALHVFRTKTPYRFIFLFLLFYSIQSTVYYVWAGLSDHLFICACIYALTGILFLKLLIENSVFLRSYQKPLLIMVTGSAMMFYLPCLGSYYWSKHVYTSVFENHKVYAWHFDRATFLSTIDPAYFSEAVDAIQAYSKDNGVFIISKYDSILPFLAHKYSAMPFPELSQFLITHHEVAKSIEALQVAHPEYLFVDTDLDRDLTPDIIHSAVPILGYLHGESLARVQRLALLNDVFNAVRDRYRPLLVGRLITVYQLKKA